MTFKIYLHSWDCCVQSSASGRGSSHSWIPSCHPLALVEVNNILVHVFSPAYFARENSFSPERHFFLIFCVFSQHGDILQSQCSLWLPSPFLPITRGITAKHHQKLHKKLSLRHMTSIIWSSTSVLDPLEFLTTSMAQTSSSGLTFTFTFVITKCFSLEQIRPMTDIAPCWKATPHFQCHFHFHFCNDKMFLLRANKAYERHITLLGSKPLRETFPDKVNSSVISQPVTPICSDLSSHQLEKTR